MPMVMITSSLHSKALLSSEDQASATLCETCGQTITIFRLPSLIWKGSGVPEGLFPHQNSFL